MNMVYLDCGGYLCHGMWTLLKRDIDGHLHSFTPSLVTIDLPDIPWAGYWQFWSLGIAVHKASGNAYFVLTVKCKG